MRRCQCLIAMAVLILSSAQADIPPPEWRLFGPGFYFLNDAEGNTAGAELDTLTSPNAIDTPDNSFIFHVGTTVSSNNTLVIGGFSQAWIRSEFPDGPDSLNEMRVMVEVGDIIANLQGGPDLEVTSLGQRADANQNTAVFDVSLREPGGAALGGGVVSVDMVTGAQSVACVPCFFPKLAEQGGNEFVLTLRLPPGNVVAVNLGDGSEISVLAQGDQYVDLENGGALDTINQVRDFGPIAFGTPGELFFRSRGRRVDGRTLSLTQNLSAALGGETSPSLARGLTEYAQDPIRIGELTLNAGSRSQSTSAATEHVCNKAGACIELCANSNFQLEQCLVRPDGPPGAPINLVGTALRNPADGSPLPQDTSFFPVGGALNLTTGAILTSQSAANQTLFGFDLTAEDIDASVTRWARMNVGGRGELIGLNGNFYDGLGIFRQSMSESLYAIDVRRQTTWNEAGSQIGRENIGSILVAKPTVGKRSAPPTAVIGSALNLGSNWRLESRSFASGGEILGYDWDIRSPAGGVLLQTTTTDPSLDFDPAGNDFVFATLRVTDDQGESDATEEPVNTKVGGGPSNPPVASFDENCVWQYCRYTDTSTDDVGIVSKQWIVKEDTGSGQQVVVLYSEDDTLEYEYLVNTDQTVELNVRDSDGQTDSASMTYGPSGAKLVNRDGDDDGDGATNIEDNCLEIANGPDAPDAGGNVQRDTNGDGFGNVCDADFNNDNLTNFADVAIFKSKFGTTDPDTDLNGDGRVNFGDLSRLRQLFAQPPGPGNPQKLPPEAAVIKTKTANAPPIIDNAGCASSSECSWTDASKDPDGTIESRVWTVLALPPTPPYATTSTEQSPKFEFPAPGTYEISLTVTDNDGLTDTETFNFEVFVVNQPPVAAFSVGCSPTLDLGQLDCAVTDESFDPDGTVSFNNLRITIDGDEIPPGGEGFQSIIINNTFTTRRTEFIIEQYVIDNDGALDYLRKDVDLLTSD